MPQATILKDRCSENSVSKSLDKPDSTDGTDSNPDISVLDYVKPGSRVNFDNLMVAYLFHKIAVFYRRKSKKSVLT
jgi:hypothetical protein